MYRKGTTICLLVPVTTLVYFNKYKFYLRIITKRYRLSKWQGTDFDAVAVSTIQTL